MNNDTPAEREAIVRWVRERSASMAKCIPDFAQTGDYMEAALMDLAVDTLNMVAKAIQDGDHLKEQDHD